MTEPPSASGEQGGDLPRNLPIRRSRAGGNPSPVDQKAPLPPNDELYLVADELRAIANMGIRFAENSYDRERYERVRAASARIVAALERRSPDEVLERYDDSLGQVTPQAGSSAAVFRDGRILLIRREDNGLWALPGGMVEVGETLAEAAVRELHEEANVKGRATRLLAVIDSRLWRSRSKTHFIHPVFLVEVEGQEPSPGPETTDAGFFPEDDLPPLSPGHKECVPLIFKLLRGEVPAPYFD